MYEFGNNLGEIFGTPSERRTQSNESIENTISQTSNNMMPSIDHETTFPQFVGRLIIGVVAVVTGYYIYNKVLNRNNEDKTDPIVKLILDDPIGKLFNDAKSSMDKKTSDWWQSVKMTLLTDELRSALDTIGDVLQQLNKFDSELEMQPTKTPLFVLLAIIRRAQEEEAAAGEVALPSIMEADVKDEYDGINGKQLFTF